MLVCVRVHIVYVCTIVREAIVNTIVLCKNLIHMLVYSLVSNYKECINKDSVWLVAIHTPA